jgi:mono/diheme cytochrome c family protein
MPRPLVSLLAAAVAAAPLAGPAIAKTMSNEQAAQLFATTCGWCHSDGGRTAGKGPKLAQTKRSDSFIVQRIKTGSENGMPSFAGALNDDQIKGIIRYIRSLKSD